MTTIRSLLIVTLISLSALCAADTLAEDYQSAETEQRLAEARERLNLSEEQLEQLTPVLREGMAAQRRILSNYGIDLDNRNGSGNWLGLRQARAMRQEMALVRSDTIAAADKILTDAQLEELKQMQKERQKEMRERIRGAGF